MTNVVVIGGRLTRDSESKVSSKGTAILSFSIACDRWAGEKKTSYFDVTLFGKRAESLGRHLTKGLAVTVIGELEQQRWDDKSDGSKRSKVVIIGNDVDIHWPGKGEGKGEAGGSQGPSGYKASDGNSGYVANDGDFQDDIPF